jgi:hypothetical protein
MLAVSRHTKFRKEKSQGNDVSSNHTHAPSPGKSGDPGVLSEGGETSPTDQTSRTACCSDSNVDSQFRQMIVDLQPETERDCEMTGHVPVGVASNDSIRSDELSDLREQVEGKNELIAALVAELEQVVEQLDRAKRSGSDRGRSAPLAGGLPAEVVEEHQLVIADMQRVVSQWEELQAASAFGRIEDQLAELRSLVAGGNRFATPRSDHQNDEQNEQNDQEDRYARSSGMDTVMETLSGSETIEIPASGAGGAAWEAMKRQMLGEPAPSDDSSEAGCGELQQLLKGIAAPSPFDIDAATIEALRQACSERDTYIVQVTRWVRTHRTVELPSNWDELQSVPDDMRRHVNDLASRLEEQVRLAEVEMSLERARISREKSLLQSERAVLDKHLKRLGLNSLDELEEISVNSSSTSDRRWMRFLGVNRKS